MADTRRDEEWSRTSAMMALLFNINRDCKKSRIAGPEDFNPYRKQKKRRPPSRGESDYAFSIMKKVWVDKK